MTWQGAKYRVTDVSCISHPEYMLGSRGKKPGTYVMLYPVSRDVEEPEGWIRASSRVKLVQRKKKRR